MNPILRFIWVWGGGAAAVLVGLMAYFRGGTPEKWGAAIFLASWFVPSEIDSLFGHFGHHHGFRAVLFAGDALATIAYLIVGLRWWRLWAFACAGSQLAAVLTHILTWYTVGGRTWSYITLADIFGGDLPMIILGIGVVLAPRLRFDNRTDGRRLPAIEPRGD